MVLCVLISKTTIFENSIGLDMVSRKLTSYITFRNFWKFLVLFFQKKSCSVFMYFRMSKLLFVRIKVLVVAHPQDLFLSAFVRRKMIYLQWSPQRRKLQKKSQSITAVPSKQLLLQLVVGHHLLQSRRRGKERVAGRNQKHQMVHLWRKWKQKMWDWFGVITAFI